MSVSVGSGTLSAWQLWAAQQQAQQRTAQAADIASGGTTAATSTSADPGATSFMAELQGLMTQLQQFGAGGNSDGSSASVINQAGTVASAMPSWGPLPVGSQSMGAVADDVTMSSAASLGSDASKLVNDLQAFMVQMQGNAPAGSAPNAAASSAAVSSVAVSGTDDAGTASGTSGSGTDLAATLNSDLLTFMSALQSGQLSSSQASAASADTTRATSASTSDTDTDTTTPTRPASAHRHHHHHMTEALDSYASQSGTQSTDAVSLTTSVSA